MNKFNNLSSGSRFRRIASRITPRIYLSDLYTASDENELTSLGITHVVSVIEHQPNLPTSITPEQRLHLPIADRSDVDILMHFETTTTFISSALAQNNDNKVLVHCFQGISRSATIVCAYLVATTSMSATESISHVQELREIVCPNLGFRKQLDEYGTRFVGKRFKPSQSPAERLSKIGGNIAERIRRLKLASGVRNLELASNTGPEQDSE